MANTTRYEIIGEGQYHVLAQGWWAEVAMIELVGSELVKRPADRAKRREERLKARQEGREPEEGEREEKGEKEQRSPVVLRNCRPWRD